MLVAGLAACKKDSTSFAHTPTRVIFLTEPTNAGADSSLATLDVGIVDNTGTVRTTATSSVTLAIANNPGGATLSGVTTVSALNGIATFSGVKLNKGGAGYTLVATSSGLTPDTSNSFNGP